MEQANAAYMLTHDSEAEETPWAGWSAKLQLVPTLHRSLFGRDAAFEEIGPAFSATVYLSGRPKEGGRKRKVYPKSVPEA